MKRLKVPAERVKLVLNKVEPDVGMDVAQITRYFPQGFSVVVPYGREANRALNMGMPLLAFAPRSDVSRALIAGLATAMPVEPDVEVEESTPRHRFARLRLRPA
jgi:Flp pilus assembly CpaE family ATPase